MRRCARQARRGPRAPRARPAVPRRDRAHLQLSRCEADHAPVPLDVLAALPPETTRVEVDHANPAMVDRVRGAIGRPGVEVVHRPQLRLAAVFTPTADRAH